MCGVDRWMDEGRYCKMACNFSIDMHQFIDHLLFQMTGLVQGLDDLKRCSMTDDMREVVVKGRSGCDKETTAYLLEISIYH